MGAEGAGLRMLLRMQEIRWHELQMAPRALNTQSPFMGLRESLAPRPICAVFHF